MTGGLLSVGFDPYGAYALSAYGGSGCSAAQEGLDAALLPGNIEPDAIVVRGPAGPDQYTGYCYLGHVSPRTMGTRAYALKRGATSRFRRMRAIRVVVEPKNVTSPKVSPQTHSNRLTDSQR